MDVCVCVSVSEWVSPHLIPPLALEEFEEKELSISQGREPNVRRRESLGTRSLHRDQMTPLLQEYSTSVLYYTILYYTKRRNRDRSYMEIDGLMWYTTFWSSIYDNSKMVNNISVTLSVFKWAAQIFIVSYWKNFKKFWVLLKISKVTFWRKKFIYGIMVLWLVKVR